MKCRKKENQKLMSTHAVRSLSLIWPHRHPSSKDLLGPRQNDYRRCQAFMEPGQDVPSYVVPWIFSIVLSNSSLFRGKGGDGLCDTLRFLSRCPFINSWVRVLWLFILVRQVLLHSSSFSSSSICSNSMASCSDTSK